VQIVYPNEVIGPLLGFHNLLSHDKVYIFVGVPVVKIGKVIAKFNEWGILETYLESFRPLNEWKSG